MALATMPAAAGCASRQASRSVNRTGVMAAAGFSSAPAKPEQAAEVQVVLHELSEVKRSLDVTVPAATVRKYFDKTVNEMRGSVGDMPGFRKDKIPLSIIIQQCGGPEKFKQLCIEEVLNAAMPIAMGQGIKGVQFIPDSEKITSNIQQLEKSFDPAKSLSFTVEFDRAPPLKWLKSYRDVQVSISDTGNFSTDTAAVNDLVRELLQEQGHQSVVRDRGLQKGDTAIVDLKFMLEGSKLPLPGLSADRARVDTNIDPLGVAKNLIGATAGEVRHFKISLPDDYRIELWQGATCDVEVKLRELFSWSLPQFNDEFVKEHHGQQFSSAEDLFKSLLGTTAMQRVKALDEQLGEVVKNAVVDCLEPMPLPDSLVFELGSTLYRGAMLDMVEKKVATPEEVDKLATDAMLEEYVKKRRDYIQQQLMFNMAVEDIWNAEKMQLDAKDLQDEVAMRKQEYEAAKAEYEETAMTEHVGEQMKHVQVLEWLKDHVSSSNQVTTIPWAPESA
eukprot:CAMPEP_0119107898 /NCGR_PEP_ID=MMETSP1180-20130426/12257_1 /TAXON_ID=3052 ORGANISM="Chlamydomonas cf sp, Strain CCMP681" /NCGR_SAMPLE_ID=MMETSP1180 /ASSEMBLY_ACC=CAM_ASM_000741 /LENGTH=502 /DNA_ID=CAMNT_0007093447 /DNA_START=139 /DNA_END=1647 /DNA_ORIENTATION=-